MGFYVERNASNNHHVLVYETRQGAVKLDLLWFGERSKGAVQAFRAYTKTWLALCKAPTSFNHMPRPFSFSSTAGQRTAAAVLREAAGGVMQLQVDHAGAAATVHVPGTAVEVLEALMAACAAPLDGQHPTEASANYDMPPVVTAAPLKGKEATGKAAAVVFSWPSADVAGATDSIACTAAALERFENATEQGWQGTWYLKRGGGEGVYLRLPGPADTYETQGRAILASLQPVAAALATASAGVKRTRAEVDHAAAEEAAAAQRKAAAQQRHEAEVAAEAAARAALAAIAPVSVVGPPAPV